MNTHPKYIKADRRSGHIHEIHGAKMAYFYGDDCFEIPEIGNLRLNINHGILTNYRVEPTPGFSILMEQNKCIGNSFLLYFMFQHFAPELTDIHLAAGYCKPEKSLFFLSHGCLMVMHETGPKAVDTNISSPNPEYMMCDISAIKADGYKGYPAIKEWVESWETSWDASKEETIRELEANAKKHGHTVNNYCHALRAKAL